MPSPEQPAPTQPEESAVSDEPVNLSEESETENTHEGVAQTLSEYLQEQLGENAPRVTLHFFAGPHEKDADARGIEKKIRDADIFIPEAGGWTEEDLENLRKISSGEIQPAEGFLPAPYLDGVFNALHATNKPVVLIDVPRDKAEEMEQELIDMSPDKQQGFEEALQQINEAIKSNSEILVKERERYMFSQLGPKIVEAIEAHQELKNKHELTVLLTIGYAHTGIMQELAQDAEITVTKDLAYPVSIFDHSHEALRRCSFDKDVSRDLLEKVLFEEIFMKTSVFENLFRTIQETNTLASFKRFIAGAFSGDEIRGLFDQWKRGDNFEEWFLGQLNAKGLRVPVSDEDAKKIMAD